MAIDAHEDPAFQAMCREHEIEGTAMVALCGAFWNRALASTTGEAEPAGRPEGEIPPVSDKERGLTDAERRMLNTLFDQMSDLSDKDWRDHGFRRTTFDRLARKLSGILQATPPAATPVAPGEVTDARRLDWLTEELVDTIYLDDGRIIDVGTGRIGSRNVHVSPHDLRAAIDAAMPDDKLAALSNPAPVAAPAPASEAAAEYKAGNEFLPYHPSASHVDPSYRDGWNACYVASKAPDAAAHVLGNFRTFTLTPAPGDSVDAPVQQAGAGLLREALKALLHVSVSPLHMPATKAAAEKQARAALKGEQPEPSGGERGEV